MANIPVQLGRLRLGGPSVRLGGSIAAATVTPAPAQGPALPGFGFQFNEAVGTTNLLITVVNLTTGATIPGSVSYNSSTHLATWTAAGGYYLRRGPRYLVTVSGATAPDGTPMVPAQFTMTVGSPTFGRWFNGLNRRIA